MTDFITYVSDLTAFRAEIEANPTPSFNVSEDGEFSLVNTNIPVFYNDNESLCVVRDLPDLESYDNLVILGTVTEDNQSYIFTTEETQAIYERVLGSLEATYTDSETGETINYTKPYMIGVIAR